MRVGRTFMVFNYGLLDNYNLIYTYKFWFIVKVIKVLIFPRFGNISYNK